MPDDVFLVESAEVSSAHAKVRLMQHSPCTFEAVHQSKSTRCRPIRERKEVLIQQSCRFHQSDRMLQSLSSYCNQSWYCKHWSIRRTWQPWLLASLIVPLSCSFHPVHHNNLVTFEVSRSPTLDSRLNFHCHRRCST